MKKEANGKKWSSISARILVIFNQRVGGMDDSRMLNMPMSIHQYRRLRIALCMAFDEDDIPKFYGLMPTKFSDIGSPVVEVSRKWASDHAIPTWEQITIEKLGFLEKIDEIARQ
jgi:hypothetical protein